MKKFKFKFSTKGKIILVTKFEIAGNVNVLINLYQEKDALKSDLQQHSVIHTKSFAKKRCFSSLQGRTTTITTRSLSGFDG